MKKLKLIIIALLMSVSMFSQVTVIEGEVEMYDSTWETLVEENDMIIFRGDVNFYNCGGRLYKDLCMIFQGQVSGTLWLKNDDPSLYDIEARFTLSNSAYGEIEPVGEHTLEWHNIPRYWGQTEDCYGNDMSIRNIYSPIIFETAEEFEEFVYNSGEVIFHNTVTLDFTGGVNVEVNDDYKLPCLNFKNKLLLPQGDVIFNALSFETINVNFNLSEDEAIEGFDFQSIGIVTLHFNQDASCSGEWLGDGLGIIDFEYNTVDEELFLKVTNENDLTEYKVITKDGVDNEIGYTIFPSSGAPLGYYRNYTIPTKFPSCAIGEYIIELYEKKEGSSEFKLIDKITINL